MYDRTKKIFTAALSFSLLLSSFAGGSVQPFGIYTSYAQGVEEILTENITEEPTEILTEIPTTMPTDEPTDIPTKTPTEIPFDELSEEPTELPIESPTAVPEPLKVTAERSVQKYDQNGIMNLEAFLAQYEDCFESIEAGLETYIATKVIEINENLAVDFQGAKIQVSNTFTTYSLFSITGAYEITFQNLTLDGNNQRLYTRGIESKGDSSNARANLILDNVTIQNFNSVNTGGGISGTYTDMIISNSIMQNNLSRSSEGGGIYAKNSSVSLNNVQILENRGGIYIWGDYSRQEQLTISGGEIRGNTSTRPYSGGGINAACADVVLQEEVEFIRNAAGSNGSGGGIRISEGRLTIYPGVIISENDAGTYSYGGGIYAAAATVEFVNDGSNKKTTIEGNTAVGGGGIAITTNSSLIIEGSVDITDNHAERGGGIHATTGTPVQIATDASSLVNITENTAKYDGGGIYLEKASMTLGHQSIDETPTLYISNNIAKQHGGGMYITCDSPFMSTAVDIYNVDIVENTAAFSGGAIFARSPKTLTFKGSTMANNNASVNGGGLFALLYTNGISERITMEDTVIIDNTTDATKGLGGGLYIQDNTNKNDVTTVVSIKDSELTDNTANKGGGLYAISTAKLDLLIENTRLVSNTAEDGGAIYMPIDEVKDQRGSLTVRDSVFQENRAATFATSVTEEEQRLHEERIVGSHFSYDALYGYNNYDIYHKSDDRAPYWIVTVKYDTSEISDKQTFLLADGVKIDATREEFKLKREGYILEGFYDEAQEKSTLWNFGQDVVSSDLTLVARWKKIVPPQKPKELIAIMEDLTLLVEVESKADYTGNREPSSTMDLYADHFDDVNALNKEIEKIIVDKMTLSFSDHSVLDKENLEVNVELDGLIDLDPTTLNNMGHKIQVKGISLSEADGTSFYAELSSVVTIQILDTTAPSIIASTDKILLPQDKFTRLEEALADRETVKEMLKTLLLTGDQPILETEDNYSLYDTLIWELDMDPAVNTDGSYTVLVTVQDESENKNSMHMTVLPMTKGLYLTANDIVYYQVGVEKTKMELLADLHAELSYVNEEGKKNILPINLISVDAFEASMLTKAGNYPLVLRAEYEGLKAAKNVTIVVIDKKDESTPLESENPPDFETDNNNEESITETDEIFEMTVETPLGNIRATQKETDVHGNVIYELFDEHGVPLGFVSVPPGETLESILAKENIQEQIKDNPQTGTFGTPLFYPGLLVAASILYFIWREKEKQQKTRGSK